MNDTAASTACPCGSGLEREACCGPILDGLRPAPTAEALMRSRYSAFVEGNLDHIRESLHSKARGDHDEQATKTWSEASTWHGLSVKRVEGGGEADETGEVEFVATYSQRGKRVDHHERAIFEREDGQWRFRDSAAPATGTVVREGPRIGRNEPCACGSGKKAKRCCLVT